MRWALALAVAGCVDGAPEPVDTGVDTLPQCTVPPRVELGFAQWYEQEVVPMEDGNLLGFDVGPIPMWRTFVGLHAEGVPESVRVEFRVVRISDNQVLADWADWPVWIRIPAWETGDCAGDAYALEVTLPGFRVLDLCEMHDEALQFEVQLWGEHDVLAADVVTVLAWMDPEECPTWKPRLGR